MTCMTKMTREGPDKAIVHQSFSDTDENKNEQPTCASIPGWNVLLLNMYMMQLCPEDPQLDCPKHSTLTSSTAAPLLST